MNLNPCKSCGSSAQHKKTGVVNRIECKKCKCRVICQNLDKAIMIWNGGYLSEDNTNIHLHDNFIETEIFIK